MSIDRSKLIEALLIKDELSSKMLSDQESLPSPSSRYAQSIPDLNILKKSPSVSIQSRDRSIPTSKQFRDNASSVISIDQKPSLNLENYKNRIKDLEMENIGLSSKNDSLKRENTNLEEKLKSINARLSMENASESERVKALIRENDAVMNQNGILRSKLSIVESEEAKKAREVLNLEKELSYARSEINKLKDSINSANYTLDQAELELRSQIKEYERVNFDYEVLEEEFKRESSELKQNQFKVSDLKRSLEEITNRYQSHVLESKQSSTREKELMESLKIIESSLHDYKNKCSIQSSELEVLEKKHHESLRLSKSFEEKLLLLNEKELETMKILNTNKDQVSDAILEKERALLLAEQTKKEVDRLQTRIIDLQTKYRERMETDIETVRSQAISEKRRLNEEISNLEASRSKMQHQMERAIREKRAAESELEKLTRHIPDEAERLTNVLEDLTSRLRNVQSERTQAVQKLESFQLKSHRNLTNLETQIQTLAAQLSDSSRKNTHLQTQIEQKTQILYQTTNETTKLTFKNKKLVEENEFLNGKIESELEIVIKKYEFQIKSLQGKLDCVTEAHERSVNEMQRLLGEQREMGEKWKYESQSITDHYESILIDLKSNQSRLDSRTLELEDHVDKMELKNRELCFNLQEEKKALVKRVQECRNLEVKIEGMGRQIQQILKRESEILGEKKQIERDFDRLVLEKEKLDKDRVYQTKLETRKLRNKTFANNDQIDVNNSNVENLLKEINRVNQRSEARNYRQERLSVDFGDYNIEDDED